MMIVNRKKIWYILWVLIILIGPITVFRNTQFTQISSNPVLLLNYFQRITGLLAFSLLFIQIILGALMSKWVQILGAKAYRLHITQGLLTYAFIFIHPIFYYFISYQVVGKIMLLPDRSIEVEFWIGFGRVAFTLLTIAVVVGYFRTKSFFRRNWLKIHVLNYISFFLVAVHSWNVGTDTLTLPFIWFFWFALGAVSLSIVYRVYTNFLTKIVPLDNILNK